MKVRSKKKKSRDNKRSELSVRTRPYQVTGLIRDFKPKIPVVVVSTSDGSIQAAAASFAVIDVRCLNPFSGTPTGGTGAFTNSTVGLADATAYALGRVKKVAVELSGTSLETANIDTIGYCFSDTQVSTLITGVGLPAQFAQAKALQVSNYHVKPRKLGVTSGQPKFSFPMTTVTPAAVIGDIAPVTDDSYVCTLNPATANSTREVWLGIIVTAVNAATLLALGVDISLVMTYFMEALSRLPGR